MGLLQQPIAGFSDGKSTDLSKREAQIRLSPAAAGAFFERDAGGAGRAGELQLAG